MIAQIKVQERAEKAVLNTPGGQELEAAMGAKDSGLPFFAFLDPGGKLIVNSLRPIQGKSASTNIGHPMEPEEVDWFMVMLKRAAPTLAPSEIQVIENYLRNQKKN